jgi:hypothetical protein
MKQNVVGIIFSFLLRSVFSLKLSTPLEELFGDMERDSFRVL